MIGEAMLRRSTRVSVGEGQLARRQAIADEELIHDELHLRGIHRDMAAPPFLKPEIAVGGAVHVGPDFVLLGPVGVGRVAGFRSWSPARRRRTCRRQGRRSSPSARTRRAARRGSASAPCPARRPRWRPASGHHQRSKDVRADRGGHQQRPTGLAIAHRHRPAFRLHVATADLLGEGDDARTTSSIVCPGSDRAEADEVAGMAGLHRHADLTVGLEAADARPVAGTRIDDDEGRLRGSGAGAAAGGRTRAIQ